jgi:hypothetical protein
MQFHGPVDVSVVLPFTDHEDVVGTACQRIGRHLGELGLTFEILAVDEDSGDNSHMVLGLLRRSIPELSVLRSEPGRGYAAGSAIARGRTLWLLDPENATRSLAAFGRAHGRVHRGELDIAVVRGRFIVCKRARGIGFLEGLTGRGATFERRLLRRAQRRQLAVEAYEVGGHHHGGLAHRLRWRLALALGAVRA